MKLSDKVIDSLFDLVENGDDGYIVASSSMVPVLNPGDKIEIIPVEFEKIEVGQVIVFKNQYEKLIVHRVVRKKKAQIITAGDSLRKYDSPLNREDIVGTVKGLDIAKPLSMLQRIIRAFKRRMVKFL